MVRFFFLTVFSRLNLGVTNVPVSTSGDDNDYDTQSNFFSYEPVLATYSLQTHGERCSHFQDYFDSLGNSMLEFSKHFLHFGF